MRAPSLKPNNSTRRPPEAFRPMPATRHAVSLLEARARRRRLREPRTPHRGDGFESG